MTLKLLELGCHIPETPVDVLTLVSTDGHVTVEAIVPCYDRPLARGKVLLC